MSRVRIAAGLLAVAIGTAWWAGALPAAGAAALTAAPYALVGLAVVGGARAVAPPGALIGPVALLVAGLMWLLARNDLVPGADLDVVLPVVLVLGGCVVALSGDGRRWKPNVVRRYVSILWRPPIVITKTAPAKLTITAILSTVTVKLDQADYPYSSRAIEIDITVVGGRVVLALPVGWKVGPGRIHERLLHLEGTLDWTTPVISSDEVVPDDIVGGPAVVVNVMGLLGAVALPVRPAVE